MRHGYLLLLLALAASPAGAQTFFTARLTPAQEPGGVASEARGTAALALTDEGLRFFVTVDGLSGAIANAHFHRAEAGVNGPVVRGIMADFDGNTASGLWTASDAEPLTDELVAALMAGELYLNVHTAANPGGEIRGQVYPTSGTALTATLDASQEPGGVTSDGTGTAALLLTDAGLLFALTVDGLSGAIANAHFHRAEAGTNGPVVRGIMDAFDGTTAVGLWTAADAQPLTDELIAALLTGELYLNVHTAANPGGEIRGQVRLAGGWGFSAALDASQEPGDVTSDGTGTATLTLTDAGLVYRVTVTGLSGAIANAHFHRAPAGVNGGVVRGIMADFDGNTAAGVWRPSDAEPFTDEMLRALLAGELYLNVHTAANPGGEIRGQVLPDAGTSLAAALTPAQEPGGVTSDASGTAAVRLTDEGLAYRLTVDGLSGAIANAHFHGAPAGTNGGVLHGIMHAFTGNTAEGVWTAADGLTDELIRDLLAGGLYLNVHTAANPGGEIRGQVYLSGGTGLAAVLTNEQEPGDVTQEGGGTASLTLTDAGVVYHLTAAGLSGAVANAHFHHGEAGVNGGVVHGIFDRFAGGTASGVWRTSGDGALVDTLVADLLRGHLYLNLHTAANPGGEIRGQVLHAGGLGAAVQLDPGQEPGDVASDGTGTAALTLTGAGLVYDLTVTGLSGGLTNAHFHRAAAGVNGGVVRGIRDAFVGNTAGGLWSASDAEPLTAELTDAFVAGELYLNVHTAANPGGEIRGQVRARGITSTEVEPVGGEVPGAVALLQNYPNPFNPSTAIPFSVPRTSRVVLSVYNVLGQRVAVLVDGVLPAGSYEATFDARGLPSGVYPYRLEAGGTTRARAMLLMK